MDPAWIALIGTVCGGVGLKVVEHWLTRNQRTLNTRRDLREELTELANRIDQLEDEITQWRTRYYQEQEKVAVLRVQLVNAGMTPQEPTGDLP